MQVKSEASPELNSKRSNGRADAMLVGGAGGAVGGVATEMDELAKALEGYSEPAGLPQEPVEE